MSLSRESTVAVIAGVMLVFTGWAWGGVVLWTQFMTCGLGVLALLVALTPRDQTSPFRATAIRGYLWSLAIGAMAGVSVAAYDWMSASDMRAATLQLVPDAALPALALSDWAVRGALVAAGLGLAGMLVTALRIPTHARSTLLRFPPFWIGAALFGYIAVQSLNPWGLVVERDLTWKIIPQDHVSWLPAGLDAPFIGDRDPGGMNGWRQMLILSGPWMLLCALCISTVHRKTVARLAWIVCLNSLAIGIVGAVVAAGKDPSFLGYKNWFIRHPPFGPFIYRNHAGIYLYLSAALALSLTARLIERKGERADRGGPHLVSGLLFVMLCLASASTLSVGATVGAGVLLLAAPVLYFVDNKVRMALSPAPALVLLASSLILGYVVASSTNIAALRQRVEKKQAYVQQFGSDDRAPIRRAALAQFRDGGSAKTCYGWGAGSYRWTSPVYFKQQPEFVDKRGRLWGRANFAHCDWLQALIEWGAVGCAIMLCGAGWIGIQLFKSLRARSAQAAALALGVLLALIHASIDLVFYSMPILLMTALALSLLDKMERRLG